MKIKNDEAGRLSVIDKVWELSLRVSVRISVRAPTTCLPTGRRSELLLAFLNAHLTATLTWIRDLLKRKVAKADCRFQVCLIYESAPYGKTSDNRSRGSSRLSDLSRRSFRTKPDVSLPVERCSCVVFRAFFQQPSRRERPGRTVLRSP